MLDFGHLFKKNYLSENLVDFYFGNNDRVLDLTNFNLFFMSEKGNIFTICPFIVKNMVISTKNMKNIHEKIQ